jgi:hypothetical protein
MKDMKELPGSVSKKISNTPLAEEPVDKDEKFLPPETAYLLVELKDSMTLLCFTLENLRGCVHDRGAYEDAIENMQDLTLKVDRLMKKFLEHFRSLLDVRVYLFSSS